MAKYISIIRHKYPKNDTYGELFLIRRRRLLCVIFFEPYLPNKKIRIFAAINKQESSQ